MLDFDLRSRYIHVQSSKQSQRYWRSTEKPDHDGLS